MRKMELIALLLERYAFLDLLKQLDQQKRPEGRTGDIYNISNIKKYMDYSLMNSLRDKDTLPLFALYNVLSLQQIKRGG